MQAYPMVRITSTLRVSERFYGGCNVWTEAAVKGDKLNGLTSVAATKAEHSFTLRGKWEVVAFFIYSKTLVRDVVYVHKSFYFSFASLWVT